MIIYCGIYTITNLVNNKIYVGYGINIRDRFHNHKKLLRENKHHNQHLQSSYNKYGKENFKFEILEECEEQFLMGQEHFWCIMLNTHNDKFGYNLQPTDPNKKCARMHLETKDKISKANKGKKKPVGFGEQIAKRMIGIKRDYKPRGLDFSKKMTKLLVHRKHTEEWKKKKSEEVKKLLSNYRTTVYYLPNNKKIECVFLTKKEAMKYLGITITLIDQYLRGIKTPKDYKLRADKIRTNKKYCIIQKDTNNNIINIFRNAQECAIFLNLYVGTIRKYYKSGKSILGYILEYKEI